MSAIKKYGYDLARKIQIAHLRLDGMHWGTAPELPIWQEGDWLYKRMPNGQTYKRQLNGEPQPKTTRRRTLAQRSKGHPPPFLMKCVYCGTQIAEIFPTGQVRCPKCGQYRPPDRSPVKSSSTVRTGGSITIEVI